VAGPIHDGGGMVMDGQGSSRSAGRREQGAPTRPPAIDVERLADKVYQLMLAEARLERARDARRPV